MDERYAALAAVLQDYFDGLYHCDTKLLAKVFHPQARYACATDTLGGGELVHLGMADYFPIVEQRVSPASQGQERRDQIVSIEFAGRVTALARVHCAIGPKYFTDLLTFILVEGRWQIISKVFHYDLTE